MASFPGSAVPCSKIELRVQCRNLLNKDVTSKSDPCAVLFLQDKNRWYEFGRTENIKNSLDPNFAKAFELDYYFEEVQNIKIAVYDIDNKTPQLDDDDFLGQVECTIGQVVAGTPYTRALVKKDGNTPAGKGKIILSSEEMEGINDMLEMKFEAKGLDKKDFLGKSDPYLEFLRSTQSGQWQVVHRTEVIKNNLNPSWRPFYIRTQKLCAGNLERPIKIAVYDWDDSGEPDLIGENTTTVVQLKSAVASQISWPCINAKKKAKKSSYKDSGTISLVTCKVTKEYSFLDFIFGGLQLNFTVGIDFTASNGDPRSSQSLHFYSAYQPNEYEKAISAVGAVIQDYDTDKMFPTLGFGAKIPPTYQVSHGFPCNFRPDNPFCAGITGILQAYKACLTQIQLYGPTNFSPIIQHVTRFAEAAHQERAPKNYFILLILTDGVISDMGDTRDAIVYASSLPMSIIIVGVGDADFTAMNVLDGDDGVLKNSRGQPVSRDIVQFVPFRDFRQAPPAALAKHVLAEVPQQVTSYYKMMGLAPLPRPPPGAAPQTAGAPAGVPPAGVPPAGVPSAGPPSGPQSRPLPPAPNAPPGYPGQQPGAQYPGQQQPGVPYPGQQQPGAPYPGQQQPGAPYPGQQQPGAPYPGQQQPGAPYPGQQQPGAPYPGQQQPGAPYPGQQPGAPYPGQQPGAPYPGQQPGAPYPGQQPRPPIPGQQPGVPYPGK